MLSMLSYVDFRTIVSQKDDKISIVDATIQYGNRHDRENIPELLNTMSHALRYKNLYLSDYSDILVLNKEKTQFAALHISDGIGFEYVSYRGTDNTIVGWREDFAMSFEVIPAQRYAYDYLTNILARTENQIFVGGHSKGGNLALYAASQLSDEHLSRIEKIYSNDGPGLCGDIVSPDKYQRVQSKLIRIVPDFSVIGTLFEQEKADYIVQSSVDGITEHDAETWQIQGASFEIANDFKSKGKIYQKIFADWIENVDLKKRQSFVNDFFGALEGRGNVTVDELLAGGFENFEDVLFTFGASEKESKKTFGKLILSFLKGFGTIDLREVLRTKKIYQNLVLLILGIIFICFQEIAPKVVGIGCYGGLLIYSCYRLVRFYHEYKAGQLINKYKAVFYSLIAGIEILCIIENNIFLVSVNLIIGAFFLWRAWNEAKKSVLLKRCHKRHWVYHMIDTVLTGFLGIVALAVINQQAGGYMIIAGTYMVLLGFWEMLKELQLYEN